MSRALPTQRWLTRQCADGVAGRQSRNGSHESRLPFSGRRRFCAWKLARPGGLTGATFRGLEKPSGMPDQDAHGSAGGIAGRRCRHPPFAFCKAATHRANTRRVLVACRFRSPPMHCNILKPARRRSSRQLCSFCSSTRCSALAGAKASRTTPRAENFKRPARLDLLPVWRVESVGRRSVSPPRD
jgi:hypothetical protein